MSSFDQESFHLLSVSDASDSLPDLDLVIPHNSTKKKKVRIKRKDRKAYQVGSIKSTDNGWWNCTLSPQTGCANPTCLLAVLSTCVVMVLIVMVYFTSTLHNRMIMMEYQLKMKIVDDDSRSIPETLHSIQSQLQSLQSNQTEVLVNLSELTKSVAKLQSRLDIVNITMNKEGGEGQLQQSVADLGVKVSEIKQILEVTTNNSNTNTVSIKMITTELNNLKLNDIDLRNGVDTQLTSVNPDLSNINSELAEVNEKMAKQSRKVESLNSTLLNLSKNSTVMIDWVKQDVVALQGKVSQLQDDNQNVSSRLSSLSERCNSQFLTTLSNISSLQTFVSSVENKLENANLLLKTTVLPIPSSPAFPPGLFSLSTAALPVKKTSNTPTIIQPVVTSQPDQLDMQNRMGPWDKRQDQSNDGLSVSRDQK